MRMKSIVPALVIILAGALTETTTLGALAADRIAEPTVLLREAITVSDPVVRLGDLFLNVGAKAGTRVADAPAPGQRLVFNAEALYRIARAEGLPWRPASARDQVVVERESVVLTAEDLQDVIRGAFADKGADPERVEIELANPSLRVHLPVGASPEAHVQDLSFDRISRRFSAILTVPGAGDAAQRISVAGRLQAVVEVPVPTRAIARGETITRNDIEWLRLRDNRLAANTVLDAEGLIGLSARQALRAGQPIRASDVQRPTMVSKGSLVTLVLSVSNMQLTARGRALEDGGAGETVRVANVGSHAVVEGVVTGAGRVAVQFPGAMAMN